MTGWGGLTLLPHLPASSFGEAELACSPSNVSREKEIHKVGAFSRRCVYYVSYGAAIQ